MNLKEAFRFQNKIQVLMTEAQGILSKEKNITRVEKTTLQSKVVPGAEDVVVVEVPETEFVDNITDIAALLMFLLNERENGTVVKTAVIVHRGKSAAGSRM